MKVFAAAGAMGLLLGCGSSKEALVSVSVLPPAATATHGTSNDVVLFTVNGNYSSYDNGYMGTNAAGACAAKVVENTKQITNVAWSTSDTVNTSVDSNGIATCLGVTTTPATITALASGICGGVKSTAALTCE
jgi:hypothetical protein